MSNRDCPYRDFSEIIIFRAFTGFKCQVDRNIIEHLGGDNYCCLGKDYSECSRYVLQKGRLEEDRSRMTTGSD